MITECEFQNGGHCGEVERLHNRCGELQTEREKAKECGSKRIDELYQFSLDYENLRRDNDKWRAEAKRLKAENATLTSINRDTGIAWRTTRDERDRLKAENARLVKEKEELTTLVDSARVVCEASSDSLHENARLVVKNERLNADNKKLVECSLRSGEAMSSTQGVLDRLYVSVGEYADMLGAERKENKRLKMRIVGGQLSRCVDRMNVDLSTPASSFAGIFAAIRLHRRKGDDVGVYNMTTHSRKENRAPRNTTTGIGYYEHRRSTDSDNDGMYGSNHSRATDG